MSSIGGDDVYGSQGEILGGLVLILCDVFGVYVNENCVQVECQVCNQMQVIEVCNEIFIGMGMVCSFRFVISFIFIGYYDYIGGVDDQFVLLWVVYQVYNNLNVDFKVEVMCLLGEVVLDEGVVVGSLFDVVLQFVCGDVWLVYCNCFEVICNKILYCFLLMDVEGQCLYFKLVVSGQQMVVVVGVQGQVVYIDCDNWICV